MREKDREKVETDRDLNVIEYGMVCYPQLDICDPHYLCLGPTRGDCTCIMYSLIAFGFVNFVIAALLVLVHDDDQLCIFLSFMVYNIPNT